MDYTWWLGRASEGAGILTLLIGGIEFYYQ